MIHTNRPLVSAVMVTGHHEKRYSLAQVAIGCFLDQTYSEAELVILNHGSRSLACSHSRIREIKVSKHPNETIGYLRNAGLEFARGDIIVNWDDDDWHGPDRIAIQMNALALGGASLLKRQIRYSFMNDCAFCETVDDGIAGTILHRKTSSRYLELHRSSDDAFKSNFPFRAVVDNSGAEYIRFFHGLNLWPAEHIMRDLSARDTRGQRKLTPSQNDHLNYVLRSHYKEFQQAL